MESSWTQGLLLLPLLGLALGQPTVRVQQGMLQGERLITVRGEMPYSAFRSIPYAQPPLGPLRFKPPRPPHPWRGTRDATVTAPVCIQSNGSVTSQGGEDCLYLNVFTPETTFHRNGKSRAVMVFIHGGGFTYGTGNQQYNGPDYFMLRQVVLVTFNYRLGVLGFLSLLTPEIPGNVGLKDQVAALRWVQQNIAVFGGDPNKVTVFGESAGAASAHAHLLSPLSAGLFRAALSQSGTMLCPWAITLSPLQRAKRLAAAVNCSRTDVAAIARCLQRVPATQLALATTSSVIGIEEILRLDMVPFAPVVDAGIEGVEAFLPGHPDDLIQAGSFQRLPYVAGVNSAEMLIIFADIREILPNELLNSDYHKLAVGFFNGMVKSEGIKPITKLEDIKGISPELQSRLIQMVTFFIQSSSDMQFKWPTIRTIDLQSVHSPSQFLYSFDYDGALSRIKQSIPQPLRSIPGVPHADELFSLFVMPKSNTTLPPSHPAMRTLSRMVRMWTNFAETRNPTPGRDPLLNVTWSQYSRPEQRYLYVGAELSVRCDLAGDGGCLSFPPPEVAIPASPETEKQSDIVWFYVPMLSILWFSIFTMALLTVAYCALHFVLPRRSRYRYALLAVIYKL